KNSVALFQDRDTMVESTFQFGSPFMAVPTMQNSNTDATPGAFCLLHDTESIDRAEYTRRHREAWRVLVRGPEAESLVPPELSSWLRLWGRLGAELFRCFRDGDAFTRGDMITLARA